VAAAAPVRSTATIAAEAKGLLALGTSLTDRKDYGAAEIAYRRILSSGEFEQSQQKQALLGLARTYRRQGTHTKAAAIYEKYLKQFPDDGQVPDVLLDLGRTLRAVGANRMAISRFYGVINSTLKLPAEGFGHYELLAKTAQFEIAETHFESGNFEEASKYFSRLRLLDLAPVDQARAHYKSAFAMQLAGDLEGAVANLHGYLDQWPSDEHVPEARHLLAVTLRLLNRKEEAMAVTLELLKSAQEEGPDSRRWMYWQRKTGNQLANDFFQSGDTQYALAIYERLAALASDPAWALPIIYQIALCQERLRAPDRARTAYQSIIDTVAQGPTAKAPAAVNDDLRDLARMAAWRLAHLDWSEKAEKQLTTFFATGGSKPALAALSRPAPAK
jgi:TolA-binding protein